MSLELFDLTGRTALITGSTQGLGLGMARALSQAGAVVAINGRDPARVKGVVETLSAEGHNVRACAFDLTDHASVDTAVTAFEAEHGPIDILFNNAAVLNRGRLDTYDAESWRSLMATDLEGVFFTAQRVVRGMRERKRGKIINLVSLSAVTGRYDVGAYSAAKAGVMALTRQMALEWGRENVQVNAIGPGWFMTEMVQQAIVANPQLDIWVKERTPAGRWGDPAKDLSGLAIFLASAASDFVSGQTIFADGGHMTANGM
jgi:gluconate 5-dehydrogenase